MTRRTLLQWLANAAGALRLAPVRAWAQTAAFPGEYGPVLHEIAAIVLPASAGPAAAGRFEKWVREYQPGADLDHGYGNTRVRSKAPSPAPVYLGQLRALQGKVTRGSIEAQLAEAKVDSLPRSPDGRSIAADLMAFYFNSSDGYDVCYQAAINRDRCRGLDGSDKAPPPLAKGSV